MKFTSLSLPIATLLSLAAANSDSFTFKMVNVNDAKYENYSIYAYSDNAIMIGNTDETLTGEIQEDGTILSNGYMLGRNNICVQRNYWRYVDATTGAVNSWLTFYIEDGFLNIDKRGSEGIYGNTSWFYANETYELSDGTDSGVKDIHPVAIYQNWLNNDGEYGFIFQIQAIGSDGNALADYEPAGTPTLSSAPTSTTGTDLDTMLGWSDEIYDYYSSKVDSSGSTLLSDAKSLVDDILTFFYPCSDGDLITSLESALDTAISGDNDFVAAVATSIYKLVYETNKLGVVLSYFETYTQWDIDSIDIAIVHGITDGASSSDISAAVTLIAELRDLVAAGQSTCTSSSTSSSSSSSNNYLNSTTTDTSATSSGADITNKGSVVTTVLTITSCSDNGCNDQYVTTVYTTTCPESTETSSASSESSSESDNYDENYKEDTSGSSGESSEETIAETTTVSTLVSSTSAAPATNVVSTYAGGATKLSAGFHLLFGFLALALW